MFDMIREKFRNDNIKEILGNMIIFLIPFIIFLMSLLAFYPGIMTSDSFDQWAQIHSSNYSDWHPVFHSYIEFLITKIWDWPSVIAIVQILIFSIEWAIVCKIARGKDNRYRTILLQSIITMIIVLVPINFTYNITLWKDILYTYSLFALLILIYANIKKEFKYNKIDILVLSIILALISMIRYNGLLVLILSILILGTISFIKKRKKDFIILLTITLVLVSIFKIPEIFMLNVNRGNSAYKSGPFVHFTGRLLKEGRITNKKDIEFLNNIMDTGKWANYYTPYSHNSIMFSKELKNENLIKQQKEFNKIIISYMLKNPILYIRHQISVTSILWNPIPIKGSYSMYLVVPEEIKYSSKVFDIENKFVYLNNFFNSIINFIHPIKILKAMLYRGQLYLYLSILLAVIITKLNKNKYYYFLLLPMILNILSLCITIPAQDTRYVYINFITAYVLIIILAVSIITKLYNKKINN